MFGMHVVQTPIVLGRGESLWNGLEGLEQRFDIDHVTLQVDHATEVGRLLEIEREPT